MVQPPQRRKRGTKAQFDKAFEPVAIEIGQFAREWNGLHEELAVLFVALFGAPTIGVPLACWHAIPDDGLKRRMMRAAVKASRPVQKNVDAGIKDEIDWLLGEIDQLAERRNDALHAPIQVLMDTSTYVFTTEPNYFWGNPRAGKLKGKDLKIEFGGYRNRAESLRFFAIKLQMAFRGQGALPSRPASPNPAPPRNRTRPTRLTHPSPAT
jgi:hypothetical protein